MADQFGEAVMVLRVEDAELRKTLTADEQLVRQSTDRMQGDFNELKVSAGGVGDASMVASSGVAALGQAATASGSAALQATANVANLGIGLSLLGNQALGASAQLKSMAVGGLAILISPLGLVTAGVVALGIAMAVTFNETARNKIAGIGLGLNDVLERNKALAERLKQQNVDIKKRIQLLEDQVILEKTGVNRALERMLPRERELALQLQGIKAEKVAQAASEARSLAIVNRVIALRQETQILQGQKTAYDFIESSLERQARISRDKALSDKASADAAKAEESARRAVAGPQTRGEARTSINAALDMIKRQERMVFVVNTTLESMLKRGVIDIGRFDQLTAALGLPGKLGTSDPAQGPFRSGGVQAGAFRGGIAFGAVSVGDTEAVKHTKLLTDIKTATEGTRAEAAQRDRGGGAL